MGNILFEYLACNFLTLPIRPMMVFCKYNADVEVQQCLIEETCDKKGLKNANTYLRFWQVKKIFSIIIF